MYIFVTTIVFIFTISKGSLNSNMNPNFDLNNSQIDLNVLADLTKQLEAMKNKLTDTKSDKNSQTSNTEDNDVNQETNTEYYRSTKDIETSNDVINTNTSTRRNRKRHYRRFNNYKDRRRKLRSFITLPPEEFAKGLSESDFGPLHIVMSTDPPPALVGDHEFNFMGRLIPAKFSTLPTLCTVINIRRRIFLSSARCMYGLTVQSVHVDYVSTYVKTMAFLFAEHPTVRMYDEVGIVVTEESHIEPPEWHPISFYHKPRKDDQYQWFDDLRYEYIKDPVHYVIGYYQNLSRPQLTYELRKTDVYVGLNFCHELFGQRLTRVPCFSPCRFTEPEEYLKPNPKCRPYLAGDGFAIVDKRNNRLFGVASWGIGGQRDQLLPAGLAVPNSETFIKNFECAQRIIEDTLESREYLNLSLCNCPPGGCYNAGII